MSVGDMVSRRARGKWAGMVGGSEGQLGVGVAVVRPRVVDFGRWWQVGAAPPRRTAVGQSGAKYLIAEAVRATEFLRRCQSPSRRGPTAIHHGGPELR
jgi:hypothetical protein